jgi:hypothetical protein
VNDERQSRQGEQKKADLEAPYRRHIRPNSCPSRSAPHVNEEHSPLLDRGSLNDVRKTARFISKLLRRDERRRTTSYQTIDKAVGPR